MTKRIMSIVDSWRDNYHVCWKVNVENLRKKNDLPSTLGEVLSRKERFWSRVRLQNMWRLVQSKKADPTPRIPWDNIVAPHTATCHWRMWREVSRWEKSKSVEVGENDERSFPRTVRPMRGEHQEWEKEIKSLRDKFQCQEFTSTRGAPARWEEEDIIPLPQKTNKNIGRNHHHDLCSPSWWL